MDNSTRMGLAEGLANLTQYERSPWRVDGTEALHEGLEVHTRQQLHHVEEVARP